MLPDDLRPTPVLLNVMAGKVPTPRPAKRKSGGAAAGAVAGDADGVFPAPGKGAPTDGLSIMLKHV